MAKRTKRRPPPPPPPPPADTAHPWLGVYVKDEVADLAQFETWLGRRVDQNGVYVGQANWEVDYNADWIVDWWKGRVPRPRLHWSVPLIVNGASLAEAASGAYNAHYTRVAKQIALWPGTDVLYVRTGWEFNYSGMIWFASGKQAEFKKAFQNLVTCFRAVSSRFRFEWCPNIGDGNASQMDPATAYPGDSFVDVIGFDVYYIREWDDPDPLKAFASKRDRSYGLIWHRDFAKAHVKPIAFTEWGVDADNMQQYVTLKRDWMRSSGALWQNYWNRNSGNICRLSDGQYPNTGAGYRAAFGTQT